ncbi:MAG: ABC transporter ATP-binding protein [Bacilli bacterium]
MVKMFKRISKKELLFIVICLLFIVGGVYLDLLIPDYMSRITILITSNKSSIHEVLKQGGYMLLCAFGYLFCALIVGYFASYISASFSRRLRKDIYSKVEGFSEEEIKRFSTSSLLNRTTNDVTQVQMFISMGIQTILKAPIMAVLAIIKITNKSFELSLLTAGAVVILCIMIFVIVMFALPKFKVLQKLNDKINNITRDNLIGVKVVRAFNAEEFQQNKFDQSNEELTKNYLFTEKIMAIMSPGMSYIMSMLSLFIYFVGAYLITGLPVFSRITLFSDMIVFSAYAMQIIMSFMLLSFIFILYPRASTSAKRITEVLETPASIIDGKEEMVPSEKGTIEFRNVSFKYKDAKEYVIDDVSFQVKQGETIALIGSTGSGKTTIINLLLRFYDVTKGSIFIDGVNVKDYKKKDLFLKIGYVPQKAFLFKGSIGFNVSYGSKYNKDNIIKSLKVAQAFDFVSKMKNKEKSLVSQSGNNLSGGQKQRLAIARAIYRNPEIYVFDDSFSALDYKTDATLRGDLKKYTSNATSIIVAQRIGTIMNADKIIVLDNGKAVGEGTHDELMKSCDVYKEIAYSQLSIREARG